MLYVLTALKCEAAALEGLPGKHLVTGVGGFAAKALQNLELDPSDSIINVGCAAGLKVGCYLVNSVTDEDSGRRYYPDMLMGPLLPEAPLITSSSVVTDPKPGYLYDMEASLICCHAMKKLAPSRIAIVKAVSDDGSRRPSANEVTALIRGYRKEIEQIIEFLNREPQNADYMPLPETVMEELRLTQYMKCEFEDLVHYCVVSGKTERLNGILDEMRACGTLPVKDKRQGRRVLDEIFSRIR
jgi:hypothetical protein